MLLKCLTVANKGEERVAGLVWTEELVKMESYHVRFERAGSECESESSWYSYLSSGKTTPLPALLCSSPLPLVHYVPVHYTIHKPYSALAHYPQAILPKPTTPQPTMPAHSAPAYSTLAPLRPTSLRPYLLYFLIPVGYKDITVHAQCHDNCPTCLTQQPLYYNTGTFTYTFH